MPPLTVTSYAEVCVVIDARVLLSCHSSAAVPSSAERCRIYHSPRGYEVMCGLMVATVPTPCVVWSVSPGLCLGLS